MARILVIDDDAAYRALMREFIEQKGHTVLEAQDADDGAAVFLREQIDLVVSDLMMPVKSGIELLHELRLIKPKVLFIMVTGYPDVETAITAIKEGAYDYLAKPVEMHQLAAVMNRALATLELRSNLTMMRGLNVELLVSIPLWIVLGIVIRMLLTH